MDADVERAITDLINSLPTEEDGMSVTLQEFETALFRYIARNLQGGVVNAEKRIIEFLPYREDFWPKDYEDYKFASLTNDPLLAQLALPYAGHLYSIASRMMRAKLGERMN